MATTRAQRPPTRFALVLRSPHGGHRSTNPPKPPADRALILASGISPARLRPDPQRRSPQLRPAPLQQKTRGVVDYDAPRSIFTDIEPKWTGYSRRDYSRRPPRRCRGGTPLSGVSLRPSGRTPPGSRKNCQTSSDHLLSLVGIRLANASDTLAGRSVRALPRRRAAPSPPSRPPPPLRAE